TPRTGRRARRSARSRLRCPGSLRPRNRGIEAEQRGCSARRLLEQGRVGEPDAHQQLGVRLDPVALAVTCEEFLEPLLGLRVHERLVHDVLGLLVAELAAGLVAQELNYGVYALPFVALYRDLVVSLAR